MILAREKASGRIAQTHGMAGKSPEYYTWKSMRQRCFNPGCRQYPGYGGRGISVCNRWASFETFLADMGPRPSSKHSLDRINNSGNYTPSNCRWATATQQMRNRRFNRLITWRGETLPVCVWAERTGISAMVLYSRLHLGWTHKRTMEQPVRIMSL